MNTLFELLFTVTWLYSWVVIIGAVLSWLIAFGVINTQNRFVYTLVDVIYRLTEPALRPIRRFLPDFGGIDISPVVLLLLLIYVPKFLFEMYVSFLGAAV